MEAFFEAHTKWEAYQLALYDIPERTKESYYTLHDPEGFGLSAYRLDPEQNEGG